MNSTDARAQREAIRLAEPGQPTLCLQVQPAHDIPARGDVLYVHGATFGADLSVFHRFDGCSWADAMNAAGFTVWCVDFAGYGKSERYAPDHDGPAGRIGDVVPQLRRAVGAVRTRNGGHAIAVVAHSWGGAVAARYAGMHPEDVRALALFAPITTRATGSLPFAAHDPAPSSHYPLSVWAQYRRFIEDVPRGQVQVLSEMHFQEWGQAFLATDPDSGTRNPPAVSTPCGPLADVQALWSGQTLVDTAQVLAPTLLVRGEWDSACSAADAQQLLGTLGTADRHYIEIERATHLMHLESQRPLLYNAVNAFLLRACL